MNIAFSSCAALFSRWYTSSFFVLITVIYNKNKTKRNKKFNEEVYIMKETNNTTFCSLLTLSFRSTSHTDTISPNFDTLYLKNQTF